MPLTPTDATFSYRELLLMPLRGTILLATLGLAALYLLGQLGGVLGLWLRVITVIAAIRYAQIVVEKLAHGYKEPPPLSPHDFNIFHNFGAMGFYALLVILFLFGRALISHAPPAVVIAYVVAAAFAIPALLATAVLENSVTSAFNPVRTGQIIATLGWRYVGVFALVVAGFIASAFISTWINWNFISIATSLYGMFLLSCAVGRLVYASRTDLGLDITTLQERIEQQNAALEYTQDSNALQTAHQTARLSSVEAAAQLWRYHDQTPTTTPRQLACFDSLRQWPDPMTALRFAQTLIPRLIASKRNDDALTIMRWCLRTEPEFRLADAESTYTLGMFADRAGQPRLAAGILQDMGKRFPEHPSAVSGLLRAGAIAAEKMNHAPLLRSILAQLNALGIAADDQRLIALQQQLNQLDSSTTNAGGQP